MHAQHIFYDSSGRRRRLLTLAAVAVAIIVTAATILFALTLLITPFVPAPSDSKEKNAISLASSTALQQKKKQLSKVFLQRAKSDLDREIAETTALAKKLQQSKSAPQSKIVGAFYSNWHDTGVKSLAVHADKLTHIFPEWLHLSQEGDDIELYDWDPDSISENNDVVFIARNHGLQIHPRLNNAANGEYDKKRAHDLLASPIKQKKLARALRTWLLQQNFQGINIDLQNLGYGDFSKVPLLIGTIREEFRDTNLQISTTVPGGGGRFPLRKLSAASDFIVMLGFDEHRTDSVAGPLASLTWYANALQSALERVPPSKLVVALSNRGVDWQETTAGIANPPLGEGLTYPATLNRARLTHPNEPAPQVISIDPISLTPNFRYDDAEGKSHVVWFLDGATTYNQLLLSIKASVRGVALWGIGTEDPSTWSLLSVNLPGPSSIEPLRDIQFPYQVDFEGRGEVLSARFEPNAGRRELTLDPSNGLVSSITYESYPSSVIIERRGYREKTIALTFDDGPTEEYTNKILDILKRYDIHATFFMVGQQLQANPAIVRRVYAEGHDIGNHTYTHPNMSSVGEQRRLLELNTTQRALQSIIGHSTTLFRVPYSADVEPTNLAEVRAIETASKLNYLTIGMTIDPQDWRRFKDNPDGTQTLRTAEELVDDVMQGLDRAEGCVVLMHDGGGDRAQTIAALEKIIEHVKQRGYTFATISQLLNLPRDRIMPTIRNDEVMLVGANRFLFNLIFFIEYSLNLAFTVVLVFGLARLLLVTVLAIVGKARDRYEEYDENFTPPVSAIVAAYNEEKVITRTIESLLNSNYPSLDVIVVDDGSKDRTREVVRTHYGNNPRVKLIGQENTGKAGALNRGIEETTNEFLVCLDADTQIEANAVSRMIRHFADQSVGAVAGNVKVGNRAGLLTQWQSIEYISSQNLDRKAYSLLNAITVVPGAAGAWRRSALIVAGGFTRDTLAEDMDLTWRIRRAGMTVTTEGDAYGYTEAPDTIRSLFKQRFRWSFGSLQCLWKHRSAIFHYGWFGWVGLPTLWLFQFGSQVLAPIVDLQLLWAIGRFLSSFLFEQSLSQDWQPFNEVFAALVRVGSLYFGLFIFELISAIIAFRMDKEPLKPLRLLFLQRFAYRQIMYAVVWRAILMALVGLRQGWGHLQRTGTAQLPKA